MTLSKADMALRDASEQRLAQQRHALMGKLAAIWRKPSEGLVTEVELVNTRSGITIGGGPRSVEKDDTALTIAEWAVEEANEFLVSTGVSTAQEFHLRFGPATLRFYVYPDGSGSDPAGQGAFLGQILQHTENKESLYFDAIKGALAILGESNATMAQALASKDATINKLSADALSMVQLHAQLADTKYQRDIEMRQVERKEARIDMGVSKLMMLLDGATSIGGKLLLEKAEQKLADKGSDIDKLAELCTEEERALIAAVIARVSARVQDAHAEASARKGPPSDPSASSANGAPSP